MSQLFQAIQLTERIYWVGAIDWAIRDFHGYLTSRGTTYNAYLIIDDTVTLVDTVKAQFENELMTRIASVIDPATIDLVISNHAEMDHSGCLPQVIERCKPKRVVTSKAGVKALRAHFALPPDLLVPVADGEQLNLGHETLTFHETRMLHWPESMVTHATEAGVLFSQDAFGMHLASSERFDDQLPSALLQDEGAKYYANILTPFSKLVTKAIDKLIDAELRLDIIAPDHGPIWRTSPTSVLEWYRGWADPTASRKAVVVYDTMWSSTQRMAQAVVDGLIAGGMQASLMSLKHNHRSDIATACLRAGALVVGTPTMNNNLFPTVADCMSYLRGLKMRHLVVGAFGSYGWSGEGVKQVCEFFDDMGLACQGTVTCTYRPDQAVLGECHALGKQIADNVIAKLG